MVDGIAVGGELGADQVRAGHRFVVAVEQQLRLQIQHRLRRRGTGQGIAVTVAADGHQVGEVAEGAAEQIAGEHDPVLRQPHHQRVVGLGAGCGDQHDIQPAQREFVALLEEHIRRGPVLGVDRHVAGGGVALEDRPEVVLEAERGARAAESLQPRIVFLVLGIARLRDIDQPRVQVAKVLHATHVVHVALGGDQVPDRRVRELAQVVTMHRRLESHAAVDQDAACRGLDQVDVGIALGHHDEVVDARAAGVELRRRRGDPAGLVQGLSHDAGPCSC